MNPSLASTFCFKGAESLNWLLSRSLEVCSPAEISFFPDMQVLCNTPMTETIHSNLHLLLPLIFARIVNPTSTFTNQTL